MIGKTLNHFKVLDRLGKGGMGEVYVAEDSKLKRRVALKVLPEEVARDPARLDRFQREAESIAALNHPNIVTIYSIEEADGIRFLTMELVEGETLIQLIPSNGMDVESFVRFSAPVAEALSAAHEKGIIHRDLKPGNIMVSQEGRIKVLDFGLAKLMRDDSDPDSSRMETHAQTEAGIVLGTMPYMSPEQIQGKRLDHRSDIFSLGIIFYEMITGRRPFQGDTSAELISSIMRDTPERVSDLKAGMPEHLERIIRRCLMKDSRDRYQTARDVYNELRDLNTSSGSTRPASSSASGGNSIAVLPFTNMSADDENEYFCDGLAEELLNALAKIEDLKVAARTSSFSFKNKNADASQIGKALHVKTILEGSVRRSGNKLRITVQLINAADGYHLWSERYDREMQDIFDVQDEISLAVVDALKLKLFGDEKAAVLKRYTDDAEVHELFLKGRYYSYKYTAEGWKRAIEFFERAIEKQPDYAPAYAGMASSYGCLWFFGFLPAGQTMPQCRAATIKALKLDENLADAYLSQAIITFFYDWEWEKAEQAFKRSITLNPNNAEALSYYALFLSFEERFDEAISQGKRSLEIDPLSPLINMNVGWTYFSAGLLDEALDQAGKMIEIEPDFYGAYWLKGAIRLSEGEYVEAVEELKKAVSLGGHQIVLADLGSAYGLAGKKDKATAILDRLLEMRRRKYVPAICMARVYSRIGEKEKSIEWLEKAFEERNGEMVFLKGEITGATDSDSLNSLGSDPKLIELLQKMKLP